MTIDSDMSRVSVTYPDQGDAVLLSKPHEWTCKIYIALVGSNVFHRNQ